MDTGFTHRLSLEIGEVLGFPVYWYGAVYTIGFLGVLGWLMVRRSRLHWSRRDVVEFTILMSAGILIGGRAFDIAVYELDYYQRHPLAALNWWAGGLATHGVLLGGTIGAALFCRLRGKSFLQMADEVVVPSAFLFGVGRIGNFIEGGVIGVETALPWGVVYDDLDGARHPVALYEAAKNFLILPVLVMVLQRFPAGRGVATASFVLLYALLRFAVDIFRDYESYWMGMGTGQLFNLTMATVGLVMLLVFLARPVPAAIADEPVGPEPRIGWLRAALLSFLCLYPLGIPTSWTQANIEEKRLETRTSADE